MADLYLSIAKQSDDVIAAIAASMDKRAREPAMQKICRDYMERLKSSGENLLEVGCGNGATTELIIEYLKPGHLTGIDPSPALVELANQRFDGTSAETAFSVGDAVDTGQSGDAFDVVIAHTVYSHLPDPVGALKEAYRVLRPGGKLAVFDGDYATNTVSLFEGDPLQSAMIATQRNLIHDLYVMRHLPRLAGEIGFEIKSVEGHGYIQTKKADYLQSLLARGLDASQRTGEFGPEISVALKDEAARRVKAGSFYGAILFVSLIARKPEA